MGKVFEFMFYNTIGGPMENTKPFRYEDGEFLTFVWVKTAFNMC